MDETQLSDPTHREPNKLYFTDLARSWVIRESKRRLDYTRAHPPLLSGDQFSIDGRDWTVSLVNEAMLLSEWPESGIRKIPFLSDFSLKYTQSRPVAVAHPPEEKKQTHYLVFGRREIGNNKYEPSFQLIPVDDETRAGLAERPDEDLLTRFFVRSKAPTKLESDTDWISNLQVRPITDITMSNKLKIPEAELSSFTTLKVAATERDRMFQAWKNAWKFFPGAAVLGGMIAVSTPVESEVMPSISGMMAGTAVGLSTVLFQKTMEILNIDLNKIITEQLNRPGIRRLARLKFAESS